MKKIILVFVIVILIISAVGFYIFGKDNKKEEKVYSVGILNGYDFFGPVADGFKSKMADLGYVEGKNISYIVKKANAVSIEEYDSLAQELVNSNVDLILSFPTEASIESKKLTTGKNISVVFANANIEGLDLINSLREPGGNITGVRFPGPEIVVKRLEILLDIFPQTKKIVVPYLKDYPNVPPQLSALKNAASKKQGITVVEMPVATPDDLRVRLDSENKLKKIDAILLVAEPVSATPDFVKVFGKFSEDNKIPMGGTLLLKKYGFEYESLFGVLVDSFAVGKKAAVLADKIFRGNKAGTIPVASADVYIQINYNFAQKNRVEISENLLGSADEVIR